VRRLPAPADPYFSLAQQATVDPSVIEDHIAQVHADTELRRVVSTAALRSAIVF
jgi:hypothetical protein